MSPFGYNRYSMIAGRETASNALNVLQSARMAWCEVIGFSNSSAGRCFCTDTHNTARAYRKVAITWPWDSTKGIQRHPRS